MSGVKNTVIGIWEVRHLLSLVKAGGTHVGDGQIPKFGSVAQLVERYAVNVMVAGSRPAGAAQITLYKNWDMLKW